MITEPHGSSATATAQGGRFEFIDGLRGLAAVTVVLPHAVGLFIYPHESWLFSLFLRLADFGRGSVQVFFVVSGFAIAYSLRNAASEHFSLRRFMLRRAVRLDPPYWVGLLWSGLVVIISACATHRPVPSPSTGKVLAHLLYLQDLLGFGQFNVVFWTLCLEFQLYLVFATMIRLVLHFDGTRQTTKLGIWGQTDNYGWLMVFAFFVTLVISHTVWPMRPGWFVPFFYLFLSGSLAAWRTLGRMSDRLFQGCLLAMALAFLLRPELARALGLVTALSLYAAIRRGSLHRWLASRSIQWLGRVSYSVYLVHVPLAILFLGLRTRLSADSAIVSLICLVGTYVLTLALAHLLHSTVEVPCLRLSQRLKHRPTAPRSHVHEVPPA